MDVRPEALQKVAILSGRVADTAAELIDIAEKTADKRVADALLYKVRELIELSQGFNEIVAGVTHSRFSYPNPLASVFATNTSNKVYTPPLTQPIKNRLKGG